jgi:hypothetical protein
MKAWFPAFLRLISRSMSGTGLARRALAPSLALRVFSNGAKLFAQGSNQGPLGVASVDKDTFVAERVGAEIDFERDVNAKVIALTLKQVMRMSVVGQNRQIPRRGSPTSWLAVFAPVMPSGLADAPLALLSDGSWCPLGAGPQKRDNRCATSCCAKVQGSPRQSPLELPEANCVPPPGSAGDDKGR